MSILSWSDAGSSGSVSAAVGAPSEDRIWNLFTLVKDGQGARVLRTTYLTGAFASARLSIKKLVAAVTMPHCITLVLDGWSNINMESVWVFIALVPKIGAIILKSVNGSSASHTGEWYCGKDYSPGSAGFSSAAMYDLFIVIAEQVDKVLIEYGPEHFGAIVSDNGGGCARGRRLVTDKYPHLLGHRWTPPASSATVTAAARLFGAFQLEQARLPTHDIFVTVELKNDLAIQGTLHSVDQYLNIKLHNTRVVNEQKYPHMVSELQALLA
ncbi:TPA: U6 snRNA-associated Sm-like protein LSm2 [Trebouxia sp. C0004]